MAGLPELICAVMGCREVEGRGRFEPEAGPAGLAGGELDPAHVRAVSVLLRENVGDAQIVDLASYRPRAAPAFLSA